MFVGWIRKESILSDLEDLCKDFVIDISLVISTISKNSGLCFAAYEKDKLQAIITAYEFEDTIFINNFIYTKDFTDNDKKRVINIFLQNIDDNNKSIIFMSSLNELSLFKEFGFKEFSTFTKVLYTGKAVPFNFTNNMAKSINNNEYMTLLNSFDSKVFGEDRKDYILQDLVKNTSLFLSTQFGYQHSYSVAKSFIKLSPWIMYNEAFSEAEKLIRGLIHYRGLKNIISFIPSNVDEVVNLYKSYNFEFKEDYKLIYLNKEPNIKLENIYAF
jgi:hypothetical protein